MSRSNLRVCVRVRPVTVGEQEASTDIVVYQDNERSLSLFDPRHKGIPRQFSFHRVYCQDGTQDIFQNEIQPNLEGLFYGENFTVFAHGASGSGKTFTMEGGKGRYGGPGIIPRSVRCLFDLLNHTYSRDDFEIRFSLYEIYCEKVRDLLQDESIGKWNIHDLPIQKDLSGYEIISDLREIPVYSMEEFWNFYTGRIGLRKKARTNLNEESSRSHCFVQIKVVKRPDQTDDTNQRPRRGSMTTHEKIKQPQTGNLFLVDLAGCEDNRITGNAGKGQRMVESNAINDTYLALVKVFSAIRRRQNLSVFCRDAKLTRLLRGALEPQQKAGNKALVLITVSPSRFRFQATNNTFNYLQFRGTPIDEEEANLRFYHNYSWEPENVPLKAKKVHNSINLPQQVKQIDITENVVKHVRPSVPGIKALPDSSPPRSADGRTRRSGSLSNLSARGPRGSVSARGVAAPAIQREEIGRVIMKQHSKERANSKDRLPSEERFKVRSSSKESIGRQNSKDFGIGRQYSKDSLGRPRSSLSVDVASRYGIGAAVGGMPGPGALTLGLPPIGPPNANGVPRTQSALLPQGSVLVSGYSQVETIPPGQFEGDSSWSLHSQSYQASPRWEGSRDGPWANSKDWNDNAVDWNSKNNWPSKDWNSKGSQEYNDWNNWDEWSNCDQAYSKGKMEAKSSGIGAQNSGMGTPQKGSPQMSNATPNNNVMSQLTNFGKATNIQSSLGLQQQDDAVPGLSIQGGLPNQGGSPKQSGGLPNRGVSPHGGVRRSMSERSIGSGKNRGTKMSDLFAKVEEGSQSKSKSPSGSPSSHGSIPQTPKTQEPLPDPNARGNYPAVRDLSTMQIAVKGNDRKRDNIDGVKNRNDNDDGGPGMQKNWSMANLGSRPSSRESFRGGPAGGSTSPNKPKEFVAPCLRKSVTEREAQAAKAAATAAMSPKPEGNLSIARTAREGSPNQKRRMSSIEMRQQQAKGNAPRISPPVSPRPLNAAATSHIIRKGNQGYIGDQSSMQQGGGAKNTADGDDSSDIYRHSSVATSEAYGSERDARGSSQEERTDQSGKKGHRSGSPASSDLGSGSRAGRKDIILPIERSTREVEKNMEQTRGIFADKVNIPSGPKPYNVNPFDPTSQHRPVVHADAESDSTSFSNHRHESVKQARMRALERAVKNGENVLPQSKREELQRKQDAGFSSGNGNVIPSREIQAGMKGVLRPPSSISPRFRRNKQEDLSTTKIVRNYFQSQDQILTS